METTGPNPTQLAFIAFANTHRRAMMPWSALLKISWLPKSLVVGFWRLFNVRLGLGMRNVAE